MKTVFPNYYNNFTCIAYKCKHSCCVGWEIDIDEKTYNQYKNIDGEIGKRLRENIDNKDCPHFILSKNERCPFLNDDNLCEIILTLGESSLCQICTDHPRFRNYFTDRVEIGLGLCCEEAVNIIIDNKDKVYLLFNDDGTKPNINSPIENLILDVRNKAFNILQNRDILLYDRINQLVAEFNLKGTDYNIISWVKNLMSLERLDDKWTAILNQLIEKYDIKNDKISFPLQFEQLLIYFIYRYLPLSQDKTEIKAYMCFAILSYKIIKAICSIDLDINNDKLKEYIRLYSSEIEYSEENMNIIIDELWEDNFND